MSSSGIITISSEPDYEPAPNSPQIPEGEFRLDFTTKTAQSERGSITVALFATCRVPGRHGDIYGGRLHGAVRIVAIDVSTGRVFQHHAESGHVVPLSAVMTPDPTPARPGVAQTAFVEFNFNVDLRAQLSLPKEEARYAVFLWLDEMTSPVQFADLPGPKAEASALEKLQSAPSAPESFSFRKTESSPNPKSSEIVLTHQGVTRVYGTVNPSLFSSQKKETGEHLTVLALDYMSRRLKWRSAAIPEENLQKRECYFDFDLFNLSGDFEEDGKARPYRKIFVLAHARGALSDVLTISRRME